MPLALMFSSEIYEFFRSSHRRCFTKKGVLKNFAIFTGKFNPHMHEIFLQRYCMKWVPGDPLKEMIN